MEPIEKEVRRFYAFLFDLEWRLFIREIKREAKFLLPPAAAFFFLAGCGTLSLRPVQPDHALRKAEIVQKLGVDAPTLDTALVLDQKQCDSLDNTVTGLTASSIALGVLTGGSGLTALLTDAVPPKATGGVTLGLAVLTSTFAYLTTAFSQTYTRKCAVNLGGK